MSTPTSQSVSVTSATKHTATGTRLDEAHRGGRRGGRVGPYVIARPAVTVAAGQGAAGAATPRRSSVFWILPVEVLGSTPKCTSPGAL